MSFLKNYSHLFSKIKTSRESQLIDIVEKKFNSILIFDRINGDLGDSVDKIMSSSPNNILAYAHARNIAMTALRVQGFVDKDSLEHVQNICHKIAASINPTESQHLIAIDNSINFLRSYNNSINGLFAKTIVELTISNMKCNT